MILYRIKQASSDQTIPQFPKQTKVGLQDTVSGWAQQWTSGRYMTVVNSDY